MRPDIHVGHAPALVTRFARLLEDATRRAVARRGFCAIALPGGSVAAIFFPELARAQCDWSRVLFFQGDERAVPVDHPDSNFRLARDLWLVPAGIPPSNAHRMPVEDPDADAGARSYEGELTHTLGTPARLDMALIGVGPDGHVCSLFPGHPLLDERTRLVAAIDDAPKPPPRRLTLTLPVLWNAELLVVAALGEPKADVMRQAIEDPASSLPIAVALRGARHAIVLLDAPAAALLAR